jgi:hypothetical protein
VEDLEQLDQRLRAALAAFPEPVRRELVRILELSDEDRAEEIGVLHRSGRLPELTELLIDLEEQPEIRRLVLVALGRFRAK